MADKTNAESRPMPLWRPLSAQKGFMRPDMILRYTKAARIPSEQPDLPWNHGNIDASESAHQGGKAKRQRRVDVLTESRDFKTKLDGLSANELLDSIALECDQFAKFLSDRFQGNIKGKINLGGSHIDDHWLPEYLKPEAAKQQAPLLTGLLLTLLHGHRSKRGPSSSSVSWKFESRIEQCVSRLIHQIMYGRNTNCNILQRHIDRYIARGGERACLSQLRAAGLLPGEESREKYRTDAMNLSIQRINAELPALAVPDPARQNEFSMLLDIDPTQAVYNPNVRQLVSLFDERIKYHKCRITPSMHRSKAGEKKSGSATSTEQRNHAELAIPIDLPSLTPIILKKLQPKSGPNSIFRLQVLDAVALKQNLHEYKDMLFGSGATFLQNLLTHDETRDISAQFFSSEHRDFQELRLQATDVVSERARSKLKEADRDTATFHTLHDALRSQRSLNNAHLLGCGDERLTRLEEYAKVIIPMLYRGPIKKYMETSVMLMPADYWCFFYVHALKQCSIERLVQLGPFCDSLNNEIPVDDVMLSKLDHLLTVPGQHHVYLNTCEYAFMNGLFLINEFAAQIGRAQMSSTTARNTKIEFVTALGCAFLTIRDFLPDLHELRRTRFKNDIGFYTILHYLESILLIPNVQYELYRAGSNEKFQTLSAWWQFLLFEDQPHYSNYFIFNLALRAQEPRLAPYLNAVTEKGIESFWRLIASKISPSWTSDRITKHILEYMGGQPLHTGHEDDNPHNYKHVNLERSRENERMLSLISYASYFLMGKLTAVITSKERQGKLTILPKQLTAKESAIAQKRGDKHLPKLYCIKLSVPALSGKKWTHWRSLPLGLSLVDPGCLTVEEKALVPTPIKQCHKCNENDDRPFFRHMCFHSYHVECAEEDAACAACLKLASLLIDKKVAKFSQAMSDQCDVGDGSNSKTRQRRADEKKRKEEIAREAAASLTDEVRDMSSRERILFVQKKCEELKV